MGKNSAEYMRAYRARRKDQQLRNVLAASGVAMSYDGALHVILSLERRIAELEGEVESLRAELANRPRTHTGHRDHPTRRTQQAERDAILRKINRGG